MKEHNMPFKEFVVEERMKIASDLLLYTEKTIGQVAKEVGYANQNYFTKAYKAIRGISPVVERKKLKNIY